MQDDHQRHAHERGTDFIDGLLRRRKAQFRVTTGSQATGDATAHLDFLRRHRPRQGLNIRVACNQIHVDRTVENQTIKRVGTSPANSNDLDVKIRVDALRTENLDGGMFVHVVCVKFMGWDRGAKAVKDVGVRLKSGS